MNPAWDTDLDDRFQGLAGILPGLNPTNLLVCSPNNCEERAHLGYRAFGDYIQSWARLEKIIFVSRFQEELEETPSSVVMDALLYDSVSLLEGVRVLEDLQPKVIFNWRTFDDPSGGNDPLGPPMLDCSLLRLPSWMQFEIVLDSTSDWLEVEDVEEWLDTFCPSD